MSRKQTFELDEPVFAFNSGGSKTIFTLRHCYESFFICGGVGSGKSSASGAYLAERFISKNFGGLVLTTKISERDFWVGLAEKSGRRKDLIIVEPSPKNKHVFNFLDYEASRSEGSYTQNMVKLLKTVIQSSEEKGSGKSDDPFWDKALDLLLFNVIELVLLAYGKLSLTEMYSVVLAAPDNEKRKNTSDLPDSFERAYRKARNNVYEKVTTWRATQPPLEIQIMQGDQEYYNQMILEHIPDAKRLKAVDQFFAETFRSLSSKTRSIVLFSFSSFLHSMLQEPIFSLFCRHESTYSPEDCFKGKIILLNLPVKKYFNAGRDVQCLFKLIFQRSVERRDTSKNPRGLFLWQDESQHFITENDALFQSTSRESRISSVYITQNLSSFYASMGGDSHKSEHRVNQLLGTLATKIFHANADPHTNAWASRLIGQGWSEDISTGTQISGDFSATRNTSYRLEDMVRPEHFNFLKTGGSENDCLVEAIVHRQGRTFDNGMNWKKITFKQNKI